MIIEILQALRVVNPVDVALGIFWAVVVLVVGSSAFGYGFTKGYAKANREITREYTKVLQDELKKNADASALREAVDADDAAAVYDWMQSNGYFRKD